MDELAGRRVLVLGLGISGASAARFCAMRGAEVTLADERPRAALGEKIATLPPGISLRLGEALPDPADFDLVVPSPGVARERYAARARRVWGDLELLYRHLTAPIVAITGTNGKSTTTRLVEALLRAAGLRARAAGNIGEAALDLVASRRLRCSCRASRSRRSSFQPRVAVILNVTEDHLDRHGTLTYASAKARCRQPAGGTLCAVGRRSHRRGFRRTRAPRCVLFERRVVERGAMLDAGSVLLRGDGPPLRISLDGLGLTGAHNVENVLAALAAVHALGADVQQAARALATFEGLPHRTQIVRRRGGVLFIDDSKGTNVGAALRSLQSFDTPVVWIGGGKDKALDFSPLAAVAAKRMRAALLIGEAAPKLAAALAGAADRTCDRGRELLRSRCQATSCCCRPPAPASISSRLRTARRTLQRSGAGTSRSRGHAMSAPAVDTDTSSTGRESVLAAAAVLAAVGAVAVYSATSTLNDQATLPPHFLRHLGGVAIGVAGAFVASRLSLAFWRRSALVLWGLSVAGLALVPLLGVSVNGARRWLNLGFFQFQPVELAKVATILAVAAVLSPREERPDFSLRGLLPAALLAAVPAALLLAQPDLGNTLVLLTLVGALLFVAGAPIRLFVLPALVGMAGLLAYVSIRPYAARRITGFLDPWQHSAAEGYQLVQSFIAFGRGGAFGVGIGAGQQKLAYLPEAHTDFILSVVAEEAGLVGVLIVLGGFAALLLAGVRVAKHARDRYALLVASGMTLFLTLPAAINAAVVMGLVPTKGLALPFLSYGRSSTIACFIALGILVGLARRDAVPATAGVAGAERPTRLR